MESKNETNCASSKELIDSLKLRFLGSKDLQLVVTEMRKKRTSYALQKHKNRPNDRYQRPRSRRSTTDLLDNNVETQLKSIIVQLHYKSISVLLICQFYLHISNEFILPRQIITNVNIDTTRSNIAVNPEGDQVDLQPNEDLRCGEDWLWVSLLPTNITPDWPLLDLRSSLDCHAFLR